jgi:hydrogenase maturation protein HypF
LFKETGVRQVAMSGGVFQTRIWEQAARRLERLGLAVYTHQRVPANDGGIGLGQAVLAAL